ncbi:retron St85 family RNA-directed DNA polymerase [Blautia sp. LMAG:89]|uniref:retron St85 family RNA-directed DNA polymerase n=1 Tax=Blautia sp. LMAG:89 TaxID=1969173 RepID=UPI00257E85F4|nr:retron St85 family RNA-directed DNA polymerase [Blautia sp. LMAG:89]
MNIGNSVVLNTLGVPVINSFEHLCEQLSITEQLLYYLTYKKEYCYFQKVIPKKDKTERILNVPNLSLKVVQKWILKEILEKIFVSEQAMAFVPNKNGLRENAERHKKNIFLLEMDITNFFGTITEQQVYTLFCNIGYNSKVAGILANLCTYNNYLPQGAVTSPYIANLVCYHMDARINGYCSRKDIVYTRYADDLTFSSDNRMLLNKIEKFIKYIVTDEGFTINDKKTRYLSNDVKKTVTGITINDDSIHVDKKFKRNLRAQIYCSIKLKNYQNNSQILGKIAYVNSIEKGFRDKIIRYITNLITRTEFAGNIDVVNAFNDNKLFAELPDMVFEEVCENPFE